MGRLLALILAVLLLPASASAGGWAVATLSSTPDGVQAGEPWTVDMKILQHGVTPLEGVTPAVVLELPGGGDKRFTGKPTGQPGVYRATVVFPQAGSYAYHVDDGFTNAMPHEFGTVQIGGGSSAGGAFPWWAIAVAALAALALSLLLVRARARRAASSSAARRSARAAAPGPNG
jgi:hypothetical protein